jgi:anti-sigma-K factor RskA
MNEPIEEHNGDPNLRYAEYALGVLEADARDAVASEIATSAEAAAAVARWEIRLLPLAELIPEEPPAAHLWTQIARATQASSTGRAGSPRLQSDASLWRALAVGASALAAALLVFVLLRPAPTLVSPSYLTSTILAGNGSVGWTATVDRRHARLIVVPGAPAPLPSGRSPELWVIPAGARPVALGMIAPERPITLVLNAAALAQVAPSAQLAVSVEPPAGSPTGQPTGAVIGIGTIREVPAS